jgi:hypothetical protein
MRPGLASTATPAYFCLLARWQGYSSSSSISPTRGPLRRHPLPLALLCLNQNGKRRRQGHASRKERFPLPLPATVHAKHPRLPPRTCHVKPGHVPCPIVMPHARAWHRHGPQRGLLPSDTPKPPRIRFGFANQSPTTPRHHKPCPRAHHSPPFSPSTHLTVCYLILAELDL